jgi:hypothetical protein
VLRRIFEPTKKYRNIKKITWDFVACTLLPDFVRSIKLRGIKLMGYLVWVGKWECINNFGGKSKSKNQFRLTRHRWVDNIKTALRKLVCEVVDWIQVIQDIIQCQPSRNTVMNLNESLNQLSYYQLWSTIDHCGSRCKGWLGPPLTHTYYQLFKKDPAWCN